MDNYATAYKALKLFREAMLAFIKKHLESAYGDEWWERGVRRVFLDEDIDRLEEAFQRRFSAISVVTRPGTEQYEILDISYFTNIIEGNWKQAFDKPFNGDRRVLAWLREIAALRNPVAHPETGDLSSDDVWRGLDNIDRMLRVVDSDAARKVHQLKDTLQAESRTVAAPIKSLEGILSRDAPGLFKRMRDIRELVQEQYAPRFLPSVYVGRPGEHYRTVIERLDELVPSSTKRTISCNEIFVLLSAVQLHEIGMATDGEDPETIRALLDTFHSNTRRIILQEYESFGLSRLEANAIGYVCYGHRREGILQVPEETRVGSPPQPARLLFLTALFRLAHALDLDQELAVIFRNEGRESRGEEGPLWVSVDPDVWEISVRSMPRDAEEESLVRCAVENAQKELTICRTFLRNYDLGFHTIGCSIDSGLYELPAPKPIVVVNPYKVLAAFTEADANLFFGRDEDIDILLGKVCSYDLVTLLGESGIGKTSLLRAGLTPQLEKLGYKVVYARGYDDPAERLREAICRHIPGARSLGEKSFVDFMLAVSNLNPRTVILLDQAEEIFTRVPDETRQRFAEDLARLKSDRRFEIRLVFSLRQDYAHYLFDLSRDIPSLYQRDRTCRLARLDEKAAREAIAVPLRGAVSIDDQVLDRIVDDLQVGGSFYPPDVQIVGHQLFEKRDKEQKEISIREYETLGGAEGIIGDYFFGLVEDYPPDQKELARNILKLLVTSYETKNQFTLEELRRSLNLPAGEALPEMLARLVNDRLVSRIPDQRYELVHDYLAAQIRALWITEEELEVKRLKEMLRGWVREWQELGGEGLEHLLDTYRLKQLYEHAYELHPSKKELELIITSAVRYGAEIAPWVEQLDPETAVDILAQLLEIERAGTKPRVIEALGMTRSVKAIRHLASALGDKNKDIQRAATSALRNIPSEKAAIPLQYELKRENNLARAAPIIYALEMMRTVTAIEALQHAAVEHTDRHIRSRAREALGRVETGKLVSILIQSLDSKDESARSRAISSLGRVYSDEVFDQLIEALSNENEDLRIGALEALEHLDMERSIDSFVSAALTDSAASVRAQAVRVLAETQTDPVTEVLVRVALEDESFDVREKATAALRISGFEKASKFFFRCLSEDRSAHVIASASRLVELIGEEAIGVLAQGLGSEDSEVRKAIVEIAKVLREDAVEILYQALDDEEREIIREATVALIGIGSKEAMTFLGKRAKSEEAITDALVQALESNNATVWRRAAEVLGRLGDDRAIAPLVNALRDEDSVVWRRAAEVLGELSDEQAVGPLICVLEDEASIVRRRAAEVLGKIGHERAIEPLINAFRDDDPVVRRRAAKALGQIGAERAVGPLIAALADKDPSIRRGAIEALGTILEVPQLVDLASEAKSVRQSGARALGQLGDKRAVEPLIATLRDRDPSVRLRAAEALGQLGDKRAVEALIVATIRNRDPSVRRRAADALGKLKAEQSVEPLINALQDDDPVVRLQAAEALGRLKDERAVEPLINALQDDDPAMRLQAAEALGRLRDERAVEPLIDALQDKNPSVRQSGARALGQLGDKRAVEALITALADEDPSVRLRAAEALGQLGDKRAVEALIASLRDADPIVRRRAAEALGQLGDKRAAETLIAALGDEDPSVRLRAAAALGQLGDKRAVEALIANLRDADPSVRQSGAETLGQLGDKRAVEALIAALGDEDPSVRLRAAKALGQLGDKRAVEALIANLRDADPTVRRRAAEALGKLEDEQAVEPLINALQDDGLGVRLRAAEALGRLKDDRAIQPLINALQDENPSVRLRVAAALGKLEDEQAVTPLIAALKKDEDSVVHRQAAVSPLQQKRSRMPDQHIPHRTCIGCRKKRPKWEMVRIVRTADRGVEIDETEKKSGRGAYLCRRQECWDMALKKGRLEHALKTSLTDEAEAALQEFAHGLQETEE